MMTYRICRENTMEQIAVVNVETQLIVDGRSSLYRVKKVSSQPQLDGENVV